MTSLSRIRRTLPTRRHLSALLATALLPVAVFAGAPPAAANAPGDAATPSAPAVLFTENFDNSGTTPVLLPAYTGAAPLDETYTADPAWDGSGVCNDFIASAQTPAPAGGGGCGGAWGNVQTLAKALGTWAGGSATTNHALVSYTSNNPGAGKTELQTGTPVPLPSANRFLTVEADLAGMNCFAAHPLDQFSVLDGTTAAAASSAAIDPCANPGAVVGGVDVGTYTGNLAVLFPAAAAGVQLVSQQPSGTGNDGAVDNLRLLDVTPQLDLTGAAGATPVGAPADLTFTVTNTTELDPKNGWTFTANLPTGLALANNTMATTCGSGSAAAGSAAGTIDVGGDLAAGQASCTVTVQVTSIVGGSYRLCAAQISNLIGIDPPGCTTLAFTAPVFDARADSVSVNTPVLSLGPLVNADYECKTAPGTANTTVASANLGAVGNLGVLTTAASGAIAADGTRTAAAGAETTGVSLLGGLVTADALNTTAQAQQPLTTSGPGTVTLSGGAVFTNLKVAGVSIAANPGANTTINLPLVGSVVLNQQTPIAGGAGITVNAVDITLLTGTHVTLSTSTAAVLSATATCPAS